MSQTLKLNRENQKMKKNKFGRIESRTDINKENEFRRYATLPKK
jgi:hypothetical protein